MINLVLILASVLVFFIGLIKIFGGGWAYVILTIISQSFGDSKSAVDFQKKLKPAKDLSGKLIGVAILGLSFYLFYLAGTI